jgi:hypothetical protein
MTAGNGAVMVGKYARIAPGYVQKCTQGEFGTPALSRRPQAKQRGPALRRPGSAGGWQRKELLLTIDGYSNALEPSCFVRKRLSQDKQRRPKEDVVDPSGPAYQQPRRIDFTIFSIPATAGRASVARDAKGSKSIARVLVRILEITVPLGSP